MTNETKPITVKEFKMWLEGVEEMQDANWTPSSTQWARIRAKITDIKESVELPLVKAPTHIPSSGPVTHVAPAAPVYQLAPPSGLFPTPAAELANRPFLPDSTGMPAKTPSIDTSNGTYQSSFG